jgi:hypothetical protein
VRSESEISGAERRLVTLTIASWNLITLWLNELKALRGVRVSA